MDLGFWSQNAWVCSNYGSISISSLIKKNNYSTKLRECCEVCLIICAVLLTALLINSELNKHQLLCCCNQKILMIKINSWFSLVIQWLRFQASTWELRFHMLCGGAKGKKKSLSYFLLYLVLIYHLKRETWMRTLPSYSGYLGNQKMVISSMNIQQRKFKRLKQGGKIQGQLCV